MDMERFITFTPNHRNRTFTIRVFVPGESSPYAKYRSIPQSREDFRYYCESASQRDYEQFLKTDEYYKVK